MLTQLETDALRTQIRAHQAVRDYLTEIDWEQRRYEIAKAAIANGNVYCFSSKDSPFTSVNAEATAREAIAIADALIKQLRK